MSLTIITGVDAVDVKNENTKLTLEIGEVDGQVYVAITTGDTMVRGCLMEAEAAQAFASGLVEAIARANAKA